MRFHHLAVATLLAGLSGLAPLAAQQPQDRAAEGQAAELRDRLEWTKRMWQKGYLSAAQVQEAEAKLKAAEAAAPVPEKAISPGPKWEYKVLTKGEIAELANKDFAAGLNKLGDEGWELIAVPAAPTGAAGGRGGDRGPGGRGGDGGRAPGDRAAQEAEYYFKRPKAVRILQEEKAGGQKEQAKSENNEVIRLRFLSAVDFAKTADALLGGKASGLRIVAESTTNTLLANGTPKQIEELRRLIAALDTEAIPGAAETVAQTRLLHLKYAKVLDVVKLLQDVYGKENKAFRAGADERTNSMVLFGLPRQLEDIHTLIKELDVPAEKGGDRKTP
jgi:Bacterial type II/III secretion system short domain